MSRLFVLFARMKKRARAFRYGALSSFAHLETGGVGGGGGVSEPSQVSLFLFLIVRRASGESALHNK